MVSYAKKIDRDQVKQLAQAASTSREIKRLVIPRKKDKPAAAKAVTATPYR